MGGRCRRTARGHSLPTRCPRSSSSAAGRCRAPVRASCCAGSCMAADAPEAGDPRAASLRAWEEAAPGWVRRQDIVREFGAPVATWMIDAILPQPGHRVLELAAGLGETGMLAAELVAPIGGVIISDQAEAMLLGAREQCALGEQGRVRELLEQAGFTEVRVDALELRRRHASFDELWEATLDLSRIFHDAVMPRPADELAEIRASLAEHFARFASSD